MSKYLALVLGGAVLSLALLYWALEWYLRSKGLNLSVNFVSRGVRFVVTAEPASKSALVSAHVHVLVPYVRVPYVNLFCKTSVTHSHVHVRDSAVVALRVHEVAVVLRQLERTAKEKTTGNKAKNAKKPKQDGVRKTLKIVDFLIWALTFGGLSIEMASLKIIGDDEDDVIVHMAAPTGLYVNHHVDPRALSDVEALAAEGGVFSGVGESGKGSASVAVGDTRLSSISAALALHVDCVGIKVYSKAGDAALSFSVGVNAHIVHCEDESLRASLSRGQVCVNVLHTSLNVNLSVLSAMLVERRASPQPESQLAFVRPKQGLPTFESAPESGKTSGNGVQEQANGSSLLQEVLTFLVPASLEDSRVRLIGCLATTRVCVRGANGGLTDAEPDLHFTLAHAATRVAMGGHSTERHASASVQIKGVLIDIKEHGPTKPRAHQSPAVHRVGRVLCVSDVLLEALEVPLQPCIIHNPSHPTTNEKGRVSTCLLERRVGVQFGTICGEYSVDTLLFLERLGAQVVGSGGQLSRTTGSSEKKPKRKKKEMGDTPTGLQRVMQELTFSVQGRTVAVVLVAESDCARASTFSVHDVNATHKLLNGAAVLPRTFSMSSDTPVEDINGPKESSLGAGLKTSASVGFISLTRFVPVEEFVRETRPMKAPRSTNIYDLEQMSTWNVERIISIRDIVCKMPFIVKDTNIVNQNKASLHSNAAGKPKGSPRTKTGAETATGPKVETGAETGPDVVDDAGRGIDVDLDGAERGRSSWQEGHSETGTDTPARARTQESVNSPPHAKEGEAEHTPQDTKGGNELHVKSLRLRITIPYEHRLLKLVNVSLEPINNLKRLKARTKSPKTEIKDTFSEMPALSHKAATKAPITDKRIYPWRLIISTIQLTVAVTPETLVIIEMEQPLDVEIAHVDVMRYADPSKQSSFKYHSKRPSALDLCRNVPPRLGLPRGARQPLHQAYTPPPTPTSPQLRTPTHDSPLLNGGSKSDDEAKGKHSNRRPSPGDKGPTQSQLYVCMRVPEVVGSVNGQRIAFLEGVVLTVGPDDGALLVQKDIFRKREAAYAYGDGASRTPKHAKAKRSSSKPSASSTTGTANAKPVVAPDRPYNASYTAHNLKSLYKQQYPSTYLDFLTDRDERTPDPGVDRHPLNKERYGDTDAHWHAQESYLTPTNSSNTLVAIDMDKFCLKLPFKYDFGLLVQQILGVVKVAKTGIKEIKATRLDIKNRYRDNGPENNKEDIPAKKKRSRSSISVRARDASLLLLNDPFEAKLARNYEVSVDEQVERSIRESLLADGIRILCESDDATAGDVYIEQLQEALLRTHSTIYKQRIQQTPVSEDAVLTTIWLENLDLTLHSDDSMLEHPQLMSRMRRIDLKAPFPAPESPLIRSWDTLVGFKLTLSVTQGRLSFFDYDKDFVSLGQSEIHGTLIIAEAEPATEQGYVARDRDLYDGLGVLQGRKKLSILKFFHELQLDTTRCDVVWGPSIDAALTSMNQSIDKLSTPSSGSGGQKLSSWDKCRLLFRGRCLLNADVLEVMIQSNISPITSHEGLMVTVKGMRGKIGDGDIQVKGHILCWVGSTTKYNDCPLMNLHKATLNLHWDWVMPLPTMDCQDHHRLQILGPEYVQHIPDYDPYEGYRCDSIVLKLLLSVQPLSNEGKESTDSVSLGDRPQMLWYARLIRWLSEWIGIFSRTNLQIRNGKLYGGVRPRKKGLGKSMSEFILDINLPSGLLVQYWVDTPRERGLLINAEQAKFHMTMSAAPRKGDFSPGAKIPEDGGRRRGGMSWTMESMLLKINACVIKVNPVEGGNDPLPDETDPMGFSHLLTSEELVYERAKIVETVTEDSDSDVKPRHRVHINKAKITWTKAKYQFVLYLIDMWQNHSQMQQDMSPRVLITHLETDNGGDKTPDGEGVEGAVDMSSAQVGDQVHNLITTMLACDDDDRTVLADVSMATGYEPREDEPAPAEDTKVQNLIDQHARPAFRNLEVVFSSLQVNLVGESVGENGSIIATAHHGTLESFLGRPLKVHQKRVFVPSYFKGEFRAVKLFAAPKSSDGVGISKVDRLEWVPDWFITPHFNGNKAAADAKTRQCTHTKQRTPDTRVGDDQETGGHRSHRPSGQRVHSSRHIAFPYECVGSNCDIGFLRTSMGGDTDEAVIQLLDAVNDRVLTATVPEDQAAFSSVNPLEVTFRCIIPSVDLKCKPAHFNALSEVIQSSLDRERKDAELLQSIEYALRLTNIDDFRPGITQMQERVRKCNRSIEQTERQIYLKSQEMLSSTADDCRSVYGCATPRSSPGAPWLSTPARPTMYDNAYTSPQTHTHTHTHTPANTSPHGAVDRKPSHPLDTPHTHPQTKYLRSPSVNSRKSSAAYALVKGSGTATPANTGTNTGTSSHIALASRHSASVSVPDGSASAGDTTATAPQTPRNGPDLSHFVGTYTAPLSAGSSLPAGGFSAAYRSGSMGNGSLLSLASKANQAIDGDGVSINDPCDTRSLTALNELAALFDSLEEKKRLQREARTNLRVMVSMHRTNAEERVELLKGMRNLASTRLATTEIMVDHLKLRLLDDSQYEFINFGINSFKFSTVALSDLSTAMTLSVEGLSGKNKVPNDYYSDLLQPLETPDGDAAHASFDRNLLIRVYSRSVPPVGGIDVKEHFEINVAPLEVRLTSRLTGALQSFFFPAEDAEKFLVEQEPTYKSISALNAWSSYDTDIMALEMDIADLKKRARNFGKLAETAETLQHKELAVRQFNHVYESLLLLEKRILVGQQINIVAKKEAAKDFGHKFEYVAGAMSSKEEEPTPQIKRSSTFRKSKHTKEPTADHSPLQTRMSAYGGSPMSLADHLALDDSTENVQRQSYSQPSSPNASPSLKSHRSLRLRLRSMSFKKPHSPTAEQRTKSTAEEVLPTPTANDTTHTAVRTAARSLSMALSNSNSDSERSVGVDSPRRNRSMATFKRPILNSLSAKPVSPTTESKSEGADPDSKRQNPENGEKNGRSGDDMDTISAEDTPHSNTTDVELEQDAVEPEASEATHTVNTTAEKSADNDIDIEFNPLVKRSSENSNDETTSQGPRNHRKNTLSVITLSPSILRKTSGAEPGPPPRPPLPSSIIASMSQASLDHNSTTTSLGTNGSIVFGTSNEDRTGPEKTIVGAPPVRPPPPSEAALKGTASGVDTKLSIDTILSLPETTSSAVKRRSRKSSKSDKKNKDGKKESKIHRRQRSNTMSVVGNQNATDKANSMYLSAGLEKDGAIKEESATRNSTDTPSFARRRHKRSKSAYYERPDIALLTNCNDHGTTEQSASTVEYSLKKSRSQGKPPNLRIGDITGPMRCPTVHSKLPQMDATTYAQLLQPPQSLLTLSSLSAMRSVQRDSTIVSTESWISHKSSNSAQAFRSPSFKHDTNDRGSIAHPLVDAELQHKRSTPATPNNPFEEVILRNLQAKHAPVNAQAQPSPLTHTQSQSNSLIHTPPTMQMSTLQHPPSLPAYSFSYPHASLPQSDTHAHTGATTHAHTHAHAHTWSGDQSTVGPSGSANSISAPVPGYTNSASDRRLLSRARSDASYAEGVNAPRLQPTPTDTCLSLQSLKACDTEEASVGFQIGAGSSSLHSVSSAVPSLVNGPAQEPELYTNKNMGLNLSQSLRSAALPVVVSTEDAVEGPGGMLHHPGFTADMSSTMSQSIKSQSTMDDQHSVQYSMASFDPSGTPHETADSGGRDTSQKTSSSGSKGKSKAKKIDDVDLMKARANSNMSFVYMKIPKVGVRLSYRAGDGDILFNLNDFFLSLPTLEYHDRTWAWKDLLEQIKKDCVAHVLSQVVRQKMGGNKKKSIVSHNNSSAATVDFNEGLYPLDINESGDPAATGLRFQDISKAKMLLGRSVSKRVKHTKALMKEARRNIAHNIDEVIEEVAEHIKLGPKDTPQASDDDTVQLPSVDYPLDSTMPQPHLRKSQSFLTSVRNKYRVPSTTNVSGNGADPISDEAQDRAAQVTSPHGSGSARGSAANSARGSAVNKAYNGHVQTMGTTMTQPHTTRRSSTPQTLTKVLTTITPATARVGTTGSPKIGSRSPTALVSPTIPSDAAAVALQRAYSVNTRRAPGDEGYRIVDPRENTPQLPVQTRSPGQAQQATTQMKAYRRPPPTPPVPYAKSRSDECVVESGESVGKHTDVGAKPGLR